jgi:DNA recombination protein RmuC
MNTAIIFLVIAVLAIVLITWLLVRAEYEKAGLKASLAAARERFEEQQQFVEQAQLHLKDAFGNLSAEALQRNNSSFVELAKAQLQEKVVEAKSEFEKKEQAIGALVRPLSESLEKMDTKIHQLEASRIKAYSDIWNYLDQVRSTTEGLKKETNNLVGALKTSHTRGRYGELALRRLVEHAGLFEHCDFEEQVSVEDGDSGRMRPDMIIRLPGKKTLVVDSKAPLAAYMKMFETDDAEQQRLLLGQHVYAVREHIRKLSAKAYWSQFSEAPDFVILYMHIESSYGVALQAWPEMIEEAMSSRIIVATPTVLLSILLGVGYSWNQLKTMENIEAIRDAAVELHDRSAILLEHIANIGKGLSSTIAHYNKTVGSLESNFLPQARKINALSQAYIKKQELPEVLPLETGVRPIAAPGGEEKKNPGLLS